MGKIKVIVRAIELLSVKERNELRMKFDELCAHWFDKAIERDTKAGKLGKLIAEARAELAVGMGEEF